MEFQDEAENRSKLLLRALITAVSVVLFSLLFYLLVNDHIGHLVMFILDMLIIGLFANGFFVSAVVNTEDRRRGMLKSSAIVYLVIVAVWAIAMTDGLFSIDAVGFMLFLAAFSMPYYMFILSMSYGGDGSKLLGLKPLANRFPVIKKADGHVHFRTKMVWVILTLVLYFVMTNVIIFGLDPANTIDLFSEYRAILAGSQSSLMHLGIGPIVTGSIIMQLFTGAKIIKLDLTNAEDKAVYQGVQKLIVLVMIVVEAVPQVFGFLTPSSAFEGHLDAITGGYGQVTARFLIVFQLCIGSYLVFFMDELVSKWGIGSGISLFIAAGVSQAIFTGTFNWEGSRQTARYAVAGAGEVPVGAIPKTIYILQYNSVGQLSNSGGIETILIAPPNSVVALLGTIAVFLLVVYTESSRIELPLAHGRVRGARGRYPIRLIYASNIPVILMAALLANVNVFSLLLWQHPTASKLPLIGHQWWVGGYPTSQAQADTLGIAQTTPISGAAYYLSSVNGVSEWLLPLMNPERYGAFLRGHEYYQVLLHVVIYFAVMVLGSIMFAKFWIETTNMGPEAVARQIQSSGMQIPGFRRDPRVLKRVLERYIPAVTVISGAFVGALAAGAQMIGTVGDSSGTGVLLTVGIMIRLYEDIGKEQVMEMHPVLRGFFGAE